MDFEEFYILYCPPIHVRFEYTAYIESPLDFPSKSTVWSLSLILTPHLLIPLQENCMEFESSVVAQCDSLMEAIKLRRQQLLDNVRQERQMKQRIFKEQVSHCTQRLSRATGLLQFSIEVLKESDPTAFLQVGQGHWFSDVKVKVISRESTTFLLVGQGHQS